jgi:hypothetical protein
MLQSCKKYSKGSITKLDRVNMIFFLLFGVSIREWELAFLQYNSRVRQRANSPKSLNFKLAMKGEQYTYTLGKCPIFTLQLQQKFWFSTHKHIVKIR